MNTAYAFDLDGTITTEEILPIIAAELNLEREMRTLTELTLNGSIPFQDSFRLRCAILRAVPISHVRDIVTTVSLAGGLERFIKAHRETCFVITGNLDVWVEPIIERLGCRAFTSTAQWTGDRLHGVESVLDKGDAVRAVAPDFSRVVCIGDSVNDIPMFQEADVKVAFGGIHDPAPALFDVADYAVYSEEALCRLLPTLS